VLNRRLPAVCALAVLTACGGPDLDVRPLEHDGPTWFPQVVEFEQDSGPGLSMTTDAGGFPHLAYLELVEPLPPGADPPAPDPLAPVLPAIGHAHWVEEIWTHSEVAQSDENEPLDLTAEDETAIAVDPEGGHHIAWTEGGRVMYSNDPTGEARPDVVATADAAGLSIWAEEDGTPWIAYYEVLSDPEGPSSLVRVATLEGNRWSVETAAEADSSEPYGTGVGPGADGPVVAYGSASGTNVTSRQGSIWRSEAVDPDGGLGVSMDVDGEGNPHLAYLTADGQVRHAHSIGGGPWEISDVGAGVALAGTSIALDDEGTHHIAWQRDVDLAYANNAGGEFAEVPLPEATAGGQRPKVAAGGEDVYLAWYSPVGTRLNLATYTEDEPLLAVPSPSAAPGGGTAPAECEPDGTELAIAAPPGAVTEGFDTDCLAVPVGEAYTIDFDNQDPGQIHNVNVYTDETASESLLLDPSTGTITGPDQITYEGDPIDEAGNLFFKCDIHPTTMTGTFVVAGE
jgi:hypothetical protein